MSDSPRPSRRQLQVLAACLRHGSEKAAAHELGVTLDAVKKSNYRLYQRLGVGCNTEAAEALGWLRVPCPLLAP